MIKKGHYYLSGDKCSILRVTSDIQKDTVGEYVDFDEICKDEVYTDDGTKIKQWMSVKSSQWISVQALESCYSEVTWEDWDFALETVHEYMFRDLSKPYSSKWDEHLWGRFNGIFVL